MASGKMTSERIEAALFLRHFKKQEWQEIADQLDVHRNTLRRWRDTDEWRAAAKEMLNDIRADAQLAAWRRLQMSAMHEKGSPGVTAARTVIEACEGLKSEIAHTGEFHIYTFGQDGDGDGNGDGDKDKAAET